MATKQTKKAKAKEERLEDILWSCRNHLRGKADMSDKRDVLLTLVFLKFMSDRFEEQRAIVDVYRCASEAKKIAAEADRLSREICPALVRRSGGRPAPTERGRAKPGRQDRAGRSKTGTRRSGAEQKRAATGPQRGETGVRHGVSAERV